MVSGLFRGRSLEHGWKGHDTLPGLPYEGLAAMSVAEACALQCNSKHFCKLLAQ